MSKETQTEAQRRSSKIRQMGAEIVRSLISEGYTLVSQSNGCETVTLRHRTNKNRMFIRCGHLGVYVFKNRKLLKIEHP